MRLPPIEPRHLRSLALGWIVVGSVLVLMGSGIAIAHFGYGVSISSGGATDEDSARGCMMIGAGGVFFVIMGLLVTRLRSR
jgi:hypothetical protein